jgi:hypothetical protein
MGLYCMYNGRRRKESRREKDGGVGEKEGR